MPAVHGKRLTALANEFDVSSYNTGLQVSAARQAVNLSPFGSDDKTYLAGQVSGAYTVSGNWNNDAAADLEHATNLGGSVLYTVCPAGADTAGNAAFLINGLQNGYNFTAADTDAVRHSLSGLARPVHMAGVLIHPHTTASTGATASQDDGASSALGGVAHLHITAFTGTDIIVTLEDSADNSVWATLATFATASGTGAERISFTGTVERYVRANITGTFTSATIAVAYARNRYS